MAKKLDEKIAALTRRNRKVNGHGATQGERTTRARVEDMRNATKLIKLLQTGELLPEEITTGQRRMVVAVLLRNGVLVDEASELLGVAQQTIKHDQLEIRKALAELVADFDPQQFLGRIFDEADYLVARAKRAEHWGLAWQITVDLANLLGRLGLLQPSQAKKYTVAPEEAERLEPFEMDKLTDQQLDEMYSIVKSGGGEPSPREQDSDGAIDAEVVSDGAAD